MKIIKENKNTGEIIAEYSCDEFIKLKPFGKSITIKILSNMVDEFMYQNLEIAFYIKNK